MTKIRYNKNGDTMKKKKVRIRYKNVFLFLLLFLLFFFLILFLLSYISYIGEKNEVTKIMTDLSLTDFLHHKKSDRENILVDPTEKKLYFSAILKDYMEVDMYPLLLKNKDTKGYILIEGTSFAFPFVMDKDHFYQKHSYYQTKNRIGWLYLDKKANLDTFQNMVLYADGKWADEFFSLSKTLDISWSQQNYFVYLSTSQTNSLWKPFGIYFINESSSFFNEDISFSKKSFVPFSTSVKKDDVILSIVTRFSSSQMLVLRAKLIKKMERES